jgi:hypothetical protein
VPGQAEAAESQQVQELAAVVELLLVQEPAAAI